MFNRVYIHTTPLSVCNLSIEDSLHFCSQCPALSGEREEFKRNIILSTHMLTDRYDLLIAKNALSSVCDVDLMRILLCSSQKLLISSWVGFDRWWPIIVEDIFRKSFKTIYLMYQI